MYISEELAIRVVLRLGDGTGGGEGRGVEGRDINRSYGMDG